MAEVKGIPQGLPPSCYCNSLAYPETVILVKLGVVGYWPTEFKGGKAKAIELNRELGVTEAQMECMMAGSIFGFDCPAADPRHAKGSFGSGR